MSHPALDAPPFEPATVRQCSVITARVQDHEFAQEVILLTPTEIDVATMLNDNNAAVVVDEMSMDSGGSRSGDSDLSSLESSSSSCSSSDDDEDLGNSNSNSAPQAQDPQPNNGQGDLLWRAFWMNFKARSGTTGEIRSRKFLICENRHGVHRTHVYYARVLHRYANSAEYVLTNEEVAIKVVSWDCIRSCRRTYLSEDFIKEIEALQYLSQWHREEGANYDETHVLSADVIMANKEHLYIAMPYCSGGDLCYWVASQPNQRLSEDESQYWFSQILSGLETLQRLKLCHKDLSPENLMILNSNNRNSLVIDFGMCLRIPYSENGMTYSEHGQQMHLITSRHPCGKPPHVSPEIYREEEFDGHAVDIWAAGTILLFLLSGKRFNNLHELGPAALEDPDLGVSLSPEAKDLLGKMFQLDQNDRLNLGQIRSHPFCQQI